METYLENWPINQSNTHLFVTERSLLLSSDLLPDHHEILLSRLLLICGTRVRIQLWFRFAKSAAVLSSHLKNWDQLRHPPHPQKSNWCVPWSQPFCRLESVSVAWSNVQYPTTKQIACNEWKRNCFQHVQKGTNNSTHQQCELSFQLTQALSPVQPPMRSVCRLFSQDPKYPKFFSFEWFQIPFGWKSAPKTPMPLCPFSPPQTAPKVQTQTHKKTISPLFSGRATKRERK